MRPLAPTAATRSSALDHTAPFAAVRRVDLQLTAVGPFLPGVPIPIRAVAHARRASTSTRVELLSVDDPSSSLVPASPRPTLRAHQSGAMTLGADWPLATTVTVSQPGYYRVVARAVSQPPSGNRAPDRDTLVLDTSDETLWIVVDDSGGRLTSGFDPAVIDSTHVPLYGSYGPFRLGARHARSGDAHRRPEPQPTLGVGGGGPGFNYTGQVVYLNRDTGLLEGVPNAYVDATCWDSQGSDYTMAAYTNPDGTFEVACPVGNQVNGSVGLDNAFASVRGKDGTTTGTAFESSYGHPIGQVRMPSDYASHVFTLLTRYAPLAQSRFARSRSAISVYVADADPGYGVYYSPTDDRIYTNYTTVFAPYGSFSTVHEYGHAFHWKAIEPWSNYSCYGNQHAWLQQQTLSCAFVEGFADFFAMWLAGDILVTEPFGADYGLDNNVDDLGNRTNPPANEDGVLVEASVAAFLYDLVDGPLDPDSPSNTPDAEESWDHATYPASWLANVMQYCRLDFWPLALSGADQLVYCLELAYTTTVYPEARRFSASWRKYDFVTFERSFPAPSGFQQAMVRRLWKYNLYGVLQ